MAFMPFKFLSSFYMQEIRFLLFRFFWRILYYLGKAQMGMQIQLFCSVYVEKFRAKI